MQRAWTRLSYDPCLQSRLCSSVVYVMMMSDHSMEPRQTHNYWTNHSARPREKIERENVKAVCVERNKWFDPQYTDAWADETASAFVWSHVSVSNRLSPCACMHCLFISSSLSFIINYLYSLFLSLFICSDWLNFPIAFSSDRNTFLAASLLPLDFLPRLHCFLYYRLSTWIIHSWKMKRTLRTETMPSTRISLLCKTYLKILQGQNFSNQRRTACMVVFPATKLSGRYGPPIRSPSARVCYKHEHYSQILISAPSLISLRTIRENISESTECCQRWSKVKIWKPNTAGAAWISSQFEPAFVRNDGLEILCRWCWCRYRHCGVLLFHSKLLLVNVDIFWMKIRG